MTLALLASSGSTRAAGIAAGVLLDAAFGDPRRWHPVAGFGLLAAGLERRIYRPTKARGVAFTVCALAAPVAAGLAAEAVTGRSGWPGRTDWLGEPGRPGRSGRPGPSSPGPVRSLAGAGLMAVATWAALGGTSLAREGLAMAGSLESGDLPAARQRLTHLCARDPAGLSPDQLARATVESVAENTSDAVIAPLVWAALAGVPGVLGYRAANTLDAMVGYRSERYRWFGWASARLDDVLNLAPARLTGVLTAAAATVVGGSPAQTWQTTLRDARRHPSPNAGWCEASAAGALGVRLGGANVYAGTAEVRPTLGAQGRAVEVADIRRAVRLERLVSAAGAAVSIALALALGRARR